MRTSSKPSARFQHALYQQVLYEQPGTRRRGPAPPALGARLEAGYGAQMGERAGQLAVHFERGGEFQRAAPYMQQVGEHAARRNAPYEAVAIFSKGLELLDPVYTRFTEGFATLDLQEAKALLDAC